jgi:16S rRNA processing protein RimM
VIAIHNFGAGDLIEVRPDAGGNTELVSFDETHVPAVDVAAGRIVVALSKAESEMPPPLRGRPTAKRSGGG